MGYALNCGDLIIADWHDLQNNVASEGSRQEIQVQRSRNQEIAGSIRLSLRRWFSKTRRSRGTSNLTPPESRELRRGRVPSTLGESLQSARSDSMQEEVGVADSSEADRDAIEARADFWSMSEEFYQAISRKFVSRTKLARICLSVTILLVQVVGVLRSVFFWSPECCAQFRSLVHLRNPGVRTRHR